MFLNNSWRVSSNPVDLITANSVTFIISYTFTLFLDTKLPRAGREENFQIFVGGTIGHLLRIHLLILMRYIVLQDGSKASSAHLLEGFRLG